MILHFSGFMRQENSRATRLRWPGALLLIVALSFFGPSAWADGDEHGYGHDPKSFVEHLTKKLDLTKEQQDKILPIIEDKHEKMQALHEKMKEFRDEAMKKIEAELTPDQQQKWKEMQEERQEKMKEYREKHGKKHDKGMKKDEPGM